MITKRRILLKFLTLLVTPFSYKIFSKYKKSYKHLNGWILKSTDK